MARHREQTNGVLWILPSLAIPLLISAAAWTIHVSSEGDAVAPNVRFAGIDVSGLDPQAAAAHVGWREAAFLETPVTVDLGETTVTMTAREIGFDYLYGDTVQAVVSARHNGNVWEEFVAWASTPFETVTIEDRFALDEEMARNRLARDDLVLRFPVEPQLVNTNGTIAVEPGIDGVGIDIDGVVADLANADVSSGPVEITARELAIPPTLSDPEAQSMASTVNEMTEVGLLAALGDTMKRLNAAQIRRHLITEVTDGEMAVSVDIPGFQEELERLFPEPQGEFQKPVLEVEDGEVRVVEEGAPPPICCSRESVANTARALLAGGSPIYRLETRIDDDPQKLAWARGAGVKEMVSEFTTFHACCEGRVTNIHTMADRMRGFYMLPGETLSFNEYVGPRTREKGYVAAGAIRGGYLTDEVGGGVSQFVTTMFNAAFFGALDLDEYQSHSVYFSRYPFGREATLSIPGPDLVLTNSTRYPVLIWPTYDATSITVSLYSTEHIIVEEIDQRVGYYGQCRRSEIDRQRTYPGGRVVVDTIEAFYRPADGIDCNGNQIPKRD